MTTTQTRPTTAADAPQRGSTPYLPEIEDVRPVPFTRLLRTELRKLVDTRSGRWLLIAIVLLTAIAMGVALWIGRDTGTDMLTMVTTANIPQAILIPVLGVMTAANEWSQRTALITFAQEPRRLRVMAAKTLSAVLLGVAVLAVTTLIAAAGHAVSMSLVDGGEVDVWLGWELPVNILVLQVLGVLMGVAFGALFLNVPLGIVAYFLVPTLSPLLFMATTWLREHAAWFDLMTSQSPLMGTAWLTGEQWAQIGTSAGLWILLPLVIGFVRVARREVK